MQRHHDRIGRRQAIERQQVQRGRAIDQHIGDRRLALFVEQLAQGIFELERAVGMGGDFEFDAEQIHRRRSDEQARHRGRHDDLRQSTLAHEGVIARGGAARLAVDAQARRRIALRIEIDQQDLLADGGERGAQIDGCRRFADAALLVGHHEHARIGSIFQKNPPLGDGTRIKIASSAAPIRRDAQSKWPCSGRFGC